MVLVPVLVFAGVLGLLAFLSSFSGRGSGPAGRPPRGAAPGKAKKGSKKQQQRNKKQKQAGSEAAAGLAGKPEAAAGKPEAAAVRPAEPEVEALAEASSISDAEEEEEAGGGSFLDIDDVLPSHKGVYAVEGQLDSSAWGEDSLWDGWETVDPVKYNIPRGNKLSAQGVPSTSAAPSKARSGAGAGTGSAAPAKSRNEKRREKQNLVRGLQQTRPAGSAVSERIGSKGGRRQQADPATRAANAPHVPGM